MKKSNATYNASVEIVISSDEARVIRVYPDAYKMKYKPGQYGSLGLKSDVNPEKLVKRAFCISSSMIDINDGSLIDEDKTDYFEFYFNSVPKTKREQLTPKLFNLRTGDRIYCGEKIVGFFTPDNIQSDSNILLVGSETGEAPNNSISACILKEGIGKNICNLTIGPKKWQTLYRINQEKMVGTFDNYFFRLHHCNDVSDIEKIFKNSLADKKFSEDYFGFPLNVKTTHIFLAGDPAFIGAPKKKGRWKVEKSSSGIIPILESEGFNISTRFKPGNIEYECYW